MFSPDGALLYATENDFENAAGMVGVYDATGGFRRIGEFATHGMDAHEMLLLGDGRTLAIANGGIETHPDFGRAKLNIATMKPSFVFVDRLNGDLIEKHELAPELHQLSIRHMDEDASGTLWFSGQYEGPETERPPLVGKARMGHELELVAMDDHVLAAFNNYTGAIAANRDAGTIAVSSPQGNALAVLDAATGKVVSFQTLVEVCGLAPDRDGFMATTGARPDHRGRRRRRGVRRLFLGQPCAQDRLTGAPRSDRVSQAAQTVPATSETATALRSTATNVRRLPRAGRYCRWRSRRQPCRRARRCAPAVPAPRRAIRGRARRGAAARMSGEAVISTTMTLA